MIIIRPFRGQDYDTLLALANEAAPFAPEENAQWFERRRSFDETRQIRRHYVAEQGNRVVGYGCLEQQDADPRLLRIYIVCSPAHLCGQVGQFLYSRLVVEARQLSAKALWAREFESDRALRQFFTSHGFREGQPYSVQGQPPMVICKLEIQSDSRKTERESHSGVSKTD